MSCALGFNLALHLADVQDIFDVIVSVKQLLQLMEDDVCVLKLGHRGKYLRSVGIITEPVWNEVGRFEMLED